MWVSSGTVAERREGGEGFDAEGVYSDKNDVSSCSHALDHYHRFRTIDTALLLFFFFCEPRNLTRLRKSQ